MTDEISVYNQSFWETIYKHLLYAVHIDTGISRYTDTSPLMQ